MLKHAMHEASHKRRNHFLDTSSGQRPDDFAETAHFPLIADPEGGAQDVRRFSMRQDASSKNPGFASDGRFELDVKCFLWLLS